MVAQSHDELMVRGLLQLVQSQAERIERLERANDLLQGRASVLEDVGVLLGHELRTPLTVVLGVLQSLQQPLTAGQRDLLVGRALAQAMHLKDMLDDLLRRADGEEIVIPRARQRSVRLEALLRQAVDGVSTRLEPGRVTVDVDPDLHVVTAPSRLVAVIVNLLENAAKYGGSGPVRISAGVTEDRLLTIDVTDRGPGIGDADPEDLFEPFARGDVSDTPGRGFGLHMVRILMRSLGGDASISGRRAGGTRARVWMPQRRDDDPITARDRQSAEAAARR